MEKGKAYGAAASNRRRRRGAVAPGSAWALVTGAGTGIGRCYALRLAALGYDLVLAGIAREPLETVRDEIAAAAAGSDAGHGPTENATRQTGTAAAAVGPTENATGQAGRADAAVGPTENATRQAGTADAAVGPTGNATRQAGTAEAAVGQTGNATGQAGRADAAVGLTENATGQAGRADAAVGLTENATGQAGTADMAIGPTENATRQAGTADGPDAATLSGKGPDVRIVTIDLARTEAAAELFAYTQAEGIAIDVLVNNAGVFSFRDILTTPAERIERIVLLHDLTLTQLCRLYAAQMVRRGVGGHILNMSSYSLWMPFPGLSLYSASKAYVRSFSVSFAKEVREAGIRVTAVCPAGVATDLYGLTPYWQGIGLRLRVLISADSCARRGLRALWRGRRCIVPDWWNRLWIPLCKALPMCLLRPLRRFTMKFQR